MSNRKVNVSERRLRQTAAEILETENTDLVSTEILFLKKELGEKATTSEIEKKILEVRQMPFQDVMRVAMQ